MPRDPETPAQFVQRALKVLGMSQAQLAPLVNRSQQAVSRLVQGETDDSLVIEKIHWLLARHDAMTIVDVVDARRIGWCKKSFDMDPNAFLDHLPWCGDCQAATIKAAGYIG